MSFESFKSSVEAKTIAPLLDSPPVIAAMEEMSRKRAPAVAALDAALPDGIALTDTQRQYVGRWIKDKLEQRGWRTWRQRRFSGGRVFTSGTVYIRSSAAVGDHSALPSELLPAAERVKRARALVAEIVGDAYGVDDYIRDKRAEAERD